MGRPKNPIWNQVTIIGESEKERKWLCNHCGKPYAGGATRINEHLGITKGKGNITLCPRRHDLLANEGVNNSMLPGSSNQVEAPNEFGLNNGVLPASSNQLEAPNGLDSLTGFELVDPMNPYHEEAEGHPITISACFDGPIDQNDVAGPSNVVEGLPHSDEVLEGGSSGFETDIEDEVLESGNSGFEIYIKKLRVLVDALTGWEEEVKEELQWLEYRGKKKREREEADDWLKKAGDFKKEAREIIDSFPRDALQDLQMKTHDLLCRLNSLKKASPVCCDDEDPMDTNFIEMRKLLTNNNVFFIGVCGMGGVGKTWLVTHFRNQIRKNKSFNFENVFWVTVSQDFSILKLQNSIAKRIGEKLDDDDEITDRAEILSSALEKIDRSVIILDEVWNYIDLQKVGIPLRINGIKLIITSRLKHVFQQMDFPTKNLIQLKPFNSEDYDQEEQNWDLFLLKLGCNGRPATLSGEVENTARSVVEMCEGLPLGITVMARLMKGVNDDSNIWRYTLSKLEDSSMGEDMEEEVIKVLKRSYDHLADKTIQNCFLQHALYSEVSGEVFIMNLVDEGLIQSTSSLEKIFVQGKAIVAKLKSHSLIDCLWDSDSSDLHMHGLLREMASHILKGRFMLRCGKSLHNIPEMQEWAPLLEKVSLMDNYIQEIPKDTSPECPQLSTLNFSKNMITYIPDCFFYRIKALTLLDLSYNATLTSLPNSLSSLSCLKSLLLEGCKSLESVPPLGNLQELSRLVISWTSIKEVPDGLEVLTKLRWLDLSLNSKLCVELSVIFGLTNVQYLNLYETSIAGEVEIVRGMMSRLEYFVGSFQVARNLADFVENILNRDGGLKYYNIGIRSWNILRKPNFTGRKRKIITVEDFEGFEFLLPNDLDQLDIRNNKQWSGDLCGAFSFKAPSSLREIKVSDCPKLERLCCMSGRCSFYQHLQNLQSLELYHLERLDAIWSEEDEFIGLPNLSQLKISYCDRIERLMGAAALAKFPKLESIEVRSCKLMKEVFATGLSEDDPDFTITFPNSFKRLTLSFLPELVSVCGSIIVSESPPEVTAFLCGQVSVRQSHLRHKQSPSASESNIKMEKYK